MTPHATFSETPPRRRRIRPDIHLPALIGENAPAPASTQRTHSLTRDTGLSEIVTMAFLTGILAGGAVVFWAMSISGSCANLVP